MAWFIVAIILTISAGLYFAFMPQIPLKVATGQRGTYGGNVYETRMVSVKRYGFILVFLSALALLFSSLCTVGAHNVGVPTVFGKPTGATYNSGLHLKAPWAKVTDIDATIQPEEYKGEDCIYVKISDAGTACVSVAYRWRINPDGADTIYADYRNSDKGITEAVRSALVSTNIKAAINEVFGSYDPLEGATIKDNMTPQELANATIKLPDVETFNAEIKKNVEAKISDLGDLIEIESVTVSYVKLPDTTQDRINMFNAKVMDTKLAQADVAIKNAQADANRELAESLQDPNVLVSKCLDGLISGDIQNQPGFSCSLNGGGSVVIPGTK